MSVTTFAAAQLIRALPRVRLSRAVGRLCETPLPSPVTSAVARAYARAYQVDLGEAELGLGEYPTFDAFFTRRLRDGARSIDDASLVSPADGRLSALGRVEEDSRVVVKGRSYRVAELVGDVREAERYVGGRFAVVYLSPRDYHRVHSPVDGKLVVVRGIPGDLFPVNSIGERHIPRLFVRNRRVAFCVDTQALGRVTLVMVGAVIVGRITVTALGAGPAPDGETHLEPPARVDRGDELGVFHLGSTVVLLTERGVELDRAIGPVRYGESLLRGP